MPIAVHLRGQLQLACQYFHSRVGQPLLRYETAEIRTHDETWVPWNDLPVRLHIGPGAPVCVVWDGTSELWIGEGDALPFPATGEGDQYRWAANALPILAQLLGCTLRAVHLGRDAADELDDLAFTHGYRLLLELDREWLEVFNALDENGYAVHATMPDGAWVRCA
jgi:hypothetical protein